MTFEENAVALLLRSPRFELGTILELLDIGDKEFRDMANRNDEIRDLLEARRLGTLKPVTNEPRQCKVCAEWFLPYGSERCCSDPCKVAAKIG